MPPQQTTPPTTKQLAFINSLDPDAAQPTTKDEARALITKLLDKKRSEEVEELEKCVASTYWRFSLCGYCFSWRDGMMTLKGPGGDAELYRIGKALKQFVETDEGRAVFGTYLLLKGGGEAELKFAQILGIET
jgi:hypothetical protein